MTFPFLLAALALLAAATPALGQKASSGTLRLALVEDSPSDVNIRLTLPLEQLLKGQAGRASLLEMETLPAFTSGGDYRFRLPAAPAGVSTGPAVAFETDTETALVYPPIPSFLELFAAAARDPASYRAPWSVHPSSRTLSLSLGRGRDGETVVTAVADPRRGEPARWQSTVGAIYRLRWEDQEVSVALIGRVFAGLAKLGTALSAEKARGPVVGLARGGVFGGSASEMEGRALAERLEDLGLDFAAADGSVLRFWTEASSYRTDRPDGIELLSLNLVYSTAPAVGLLPGWAIVPFGGLRAAVVGITPPSAAKYLNQAGLGHLKILDPLQALEAAIPRIKREADCVIVLVELDDDTSPLRRMARGVDLLVGEEAGGPDQAPRGRQAEASQLRRPPYDIPLWTAKAFGDALTVVEVEVSSSDARTDWRVRERQVRLDDSVASAPGLPEFEPEAYGIAFTSGPPLIPSAGRILPEGRPGGGFPRIGRQEFWTMAASLVAAETDSEVALLRVLPLSVSVVGDIPEGVVATWLRMRGDDAAVTLTLKGAQVKALIAEALAQQAREEVGLPHVGRTRFTAGGYGPGPTIHGAPIEDQQAYRVATSRVLADALDLAPGGDPRPVGRPVASLVLEALKRRSGSGLEEYRAWIEGRPATDKGLWRVNFREVGLRVQSTRVVRDSAFDAVPNSRIQGFDELLVGGAFKTDADWLKDPYKWSTTLELEYARSRLKPRGAPPVTNTTANRIMAVTSGTRRVGAIKTEWLARSWGPSLGVGYDGQFEPTPGLKRKTIYSAYPGLEFYDGSVVRRLETSGIVKRDFSRDPPNTQYGARARIMVSHGLGGSSGAKVEGEAYANYFFLTKRDLAQDLRVEGDANLRLSVPIRKHLTVAPFVDCYYFQLKTHPLWGYSLMTGVSIGFSRLWKPQYESL